MWDMIEFMGYFLNFENCKNFRKKYDIVFQETKFECY